MNNDGENIVDVSSNITSSLNDLSSNNSGFLNYNSSNIESIILDLLDSYENNLINNTRRDISRATQNISSSILTPPPPPPPPIPRLQRRNNTLSFMTSSLGNTYGNIFSSSGTNTFNDVLNNSLNDPTQDVYKNVLSEEGEKTIKFLKYNKEEYKEQPTCMISLSDFKENEDIAVLPCGHIFQKTNILNWLKNEDSRCPVCRMQLPSKEEKKNISETSGNEIPQRNTRVTPQNLLLNFLDNQIRREEEQDLQDAIIASLRETKQDTESDNSESEDGVD